MMKRPNHTLQAPPLFSKRESSLTESLSLEGAEINRNRSFYRLADNPTPKYAFFDRTRSATITIQSNRINNNAKVYYDDTKPARLCDEVYLSAENCLDMEMRMEKCLRTMIDSDNPASIAVLGRSGGFALQAMLLSLQQIHNELRFITDHHKREDDNEDILNDWKFVSWLDCPLDRSHV